ncbi:hypothetical protein [Rhodococcus sp. ARC_M6]|uniref:hypothetical protein n=1 Tax=Rhodococcus sp. ARC_M6 TaxID=2928852 RepID=UPI001FB2E166|nr:hypothetical protein [Rhodococcus sp. ARC_M6]MCJ0904831.1 hypothetical protein [Rhodococcus sp. ARC_M6]
MTSPRTRHFAQAAVVAASVAAVALGSTGIASAQDEWPPIPPYPSPSVPFDNSNFLTPDNPVYWNPLVNEDRLTSPFGTSTRIVCTSFHGVLTGCWQADQYGNPHRLVRLHANFPSVSGSGLPGGGPGHFVYPGFIPGS